MEVLLLWSKLSFVPDEIISLNIFDVSPRACTLSGALLVDKDVDFYAFLDAFNMITSFSYEKMIETRRRVLEKNFFLSREFFRASLTFIFLIDFTSFPSVRKTLEALSRTIEGFALLYDLHELN